MWYAAWYVPPTGTNYSCYFNHIDHYLAERESLVFISNTVPRSPKFDRFRSVCQKFSGLALQADAKRSTEIRLHCMGKDMGTRQLNRFPRKPSVPRTSLAFTAMVAGFTCKSPIGQQDLDFPLSLTVTQKLRDMGLGPLHSVGLTEARQRAAVQRSALLRGLDPIDVAMRKPDAGRSKLPNL